MSHASLEPANKHLNSPALTKASNARQGNTASKQPMDIANPKLSLSTRMSSIDLHEESSATPAQERDELLIAARAQPSQNHSDLGAAGAQESKVAAATVVKTEESKVEKTYQEENNYLLALALILLTAGTIAFVLFFKW